LTDAGLFAYGFGEEAMRGEQPTPRDPHDCKSAEHAQSAQPQGDKTQWHPVNAHEMTVGIKQNTETALQTYFTANPAGESQPGETKEILVP